MCLSGIIGLSLLAFSAAQSQCDQTGASYSYTESVSGNTRTIVTNFCPNVSQKMIQAPISRVVIYSLSLSLSLTMCAFFSSQHPYFNLNPNIPIDGTRTLTVPANPSLLGAAVTQNPSGSTMSADLSSQGGAVGCHKFPSLSLH